MSSRILDFQLPVKFFFSPFPILISSPQSHSKFSSAQLLSMSINNTGTNLILELLNIFSLGTLQLKKDISATHQSLNSSITPWMSPSLSNNLISPNLIFRERLILSRNTGFGILKNHFISLLILTNPVVFRAKKAQPVEAKAYQSTGEEQVDRLRSSGRGPVEEGSKPSLSPSSLLFPVKVILYRSRSDRGPVEVRLRQR
ncbi:hypothetical protein CK203_079163 [Vitis vinifera]|uniref:Uncharacterized protein n=1 Tax=Vitis vinifera TaxID=29760 RepID=A0A438DYR3_VITVI|nr:hypothetical protein CK203_079163 [Vitis vinifera]